MSDQAVVAGLDLAAVNSGFCKVGAGLSGSTLELEIHEHMAMEEKARSFDGRRDLADKLASSVGDVDLVAIEDYAKRVGKTNTTAYECGEFVGMVKDRLRELRVPVLIVPPTTMRSFLKVPTGKTGKDFILEWVEREHGFAPPYSRKKQRSDVADAFVHALIGSLYFYCKAGKISREDLSTRQARVFFGDLSKSKSALIGLLDREGIYMENQNG